MTWEWVVMILGLLWWLLAAAVLMARSAPPQAPSPSRVVGVAAHDAAEGQQVAVWLGVGPD